VSGIQTAANVYLRDTVAGTTTCVSAGALGILKLLGTATNAVSFNHALSDDGRFVAFEAAAYPNSPPAVILRYDQQTGQAALIDTKAAVLVGGSPAAAQDLAMTPDGRFIAYVANELDTSGETTSIRVWDELTGTNQVASADLTGSVVAGS